VLILAITTRDLMIFAGMGVAITTSVVLAIVSRLLAVRIGSLAAAVAICVGLAHSGWRPLLGGAQYLDTYFGCVMLFIGVLAMLLFAAVEQVARREVRTPGFPVEPSGVPTLIK